MDFLKKFFPYSFGIKDTSNFVVKIIVYVVAMIVGGALLGIIGWLNSLLPAAVAGLLGVILGLVGGLINLYCTAGIVILILVFCKVIK